MCVCVADIYLSVESLLQLEDGNRILNGESISLPIDQIVTKPGHLVRSVI